MGEAQHTPGPWKWWTSNSWKRLSQDTREATDGGVVLPIVAYGGHPDLIVKEADARLIAAAPDLLKALQTIVADWDAIAPTEPIPDEINESEHWAAARAAIARATEG